jgi:hypothetical protein
MEDGAEVAQSVSSLVYAMGVISSIHENVEGVSGAHPSPCPVFTGGYSPGVKADGA